MDPIALLDKLPPGIRGTLEKTLRSMPFIEDSLKKIPVVKKMIDGQTGDMLADMEGDLKPYKDSSYTAAALPDAGLAQSKILTEMNRLKKQEEKRWQDGYVSGAVYHGDSKHIDFLNKVYAIHSQANPLHSDLWPSATKFEAEIISMTANMLCGGDRKVGTPDEICGSVSSGGTESIMLAMKTYRDYARKTRGIKKPEMITGVTAHAAFDKAAQYFQIKRRVVPMDANYKMDVDAVKRAINRNTIVIVGSAPTFPHGVIDPIGELAELARKRGIGFHTDSCLGGFVLPFAEKLGYPVPPFDFRVPGVTSMSVDTHKFGYAAKGSSVVLYRSPELRMHQYYTVTDWPGGLYFSPTFAGSRPGALSAVCWAAMVSMGEKGYLDATQAILKTASDIKAGVATIDGVEVMGDPLWVIGLKSDTYDIYRIMDFMTKRKWNLNGLHKPACVHICVTLRHTQRGVAKRFLKDLREAVNFVKEGPSSEGGMAPVYGMAATLPARSLVGDLLKSYMDILYKV